MILKNKERQPGSIVEVVFITWKRRPRQIANTNSEGTMRKNRFSSINLQIFEALDQK